MEKRLSGSHGTIGRIPGERLGYFGWPTVARLDDGTLMVACSGLRAEHVCPFGKTVLHVSTDDGSSWSEPRVIQNSAIDDRDAGIVNLGGKKVLVSWFRSDTRQYANASWLPDEERRTWTAIFAMWKDEEVSRLVGSWVAVSEDGGSTWSEALPVPVSAPHGPIRLQSGELLYLGKDFWTGGDAKRRRGIQAARSGDNGRSWSVLGEVQLHPLTEAANYHEPHLVELPSGRLIGIIRIQSHAGAELTESGIPTFSMMQTESDDGGKSWTAARPLGFHGSPPHLMRHSSGVLVLTYGYRQAPFGQRVAFSHDDGGSWDHDWILRDDGPDSDLGYPSTVELGDGSLISVYYQKAAAGEKCSLLYSRWSLP